VNLLGDNIDTIKKNTGTLIDASKEVGLEVNTEGVKRNAYRIRVGKPEGKGPLGRPIRRWVDTIKIDLREIGWDGTDWIDLALDRDQWRDLVNTDLVNTAGKTKALEENLPILSQILRDLGWKPDRCGRKPAINRLFYRTAVHHGLFVMSTDYM
jgi:hypothetical protein